MVFNWDHFNTNAHKFNSQRVFGRYIIKISSTSPDADDLIDHNEYFLNLTGWYLLWFVYIFHVNTLDKEMEYLT